MSIKESSDELNPDVLVPERVRTDVGPRSTGDYLALAIATCGVGFLPLAPGTWGSLVGIGLYLALRQVLLLMNTKSRPVFIALQLAVIFLITLLGIWAASRTEKLSGRKDPGRVVIDEVAGQLISLVPIPLLFLWPAQVWVIVSFILFRFFDIVKPYPARRLEGLHGGLGIMADDLIAGVYGALTTALLMLAFGLFF